MYMDFFVASAASSKVKTPCFQGVSPNGEPNRVFSKATPWLIKPAALTNGVCGKKRKKKQTSGFNGH